MFTTEQLQQLQNFEEKWQLWKQTRVSLFTHDDKQQIAGIRHNLGMKAANITCHACFVSALEELMILYENRDKPGG